MTHLDLFSGIGGFSLAADRVWPGIEHVFCEIDPFCQAILKKHWPNATIYGDIRTLTNAGSQKPHRLPGLKRKKVSAPRKPYILTGGFPCQPFSHAGKRKGTDDERHLWPEMRRVIQEFSPHYVVAENVRGLLSIEGGVVFEQVCLDLEALGYEVQPFVIPACAVNAPHRRDRIWFVARNTQHDGRDGSQDRESRDEGGERNAERPHEIRQPTRPALSRGYAPHLQCDGYEGLQERSSEGERGGLERCTTWDEPWPAVAARLCRLDDGLPDGVARPKGWRNAALKAYGNAIVPQVAMQIFQAIKEINV